MNGSFKFIFVIFAIIVGASIFVNLGLKSKATQNYQSGKSADNTVTITDKQIVNNISSSSNSSVSTEQEYLIFTDKGVYTCGTMFNELKIYGQLRVGHTYDIWTSPTMEFQKEGCIVEFKEVK